MAVHSNFTARCCPHSHALAQKFTYVDSGRAGSIYVRQLLLFCSVKRTPLVDALLGYGGHGGGDSNPQLGIVRLLVSLFLFCTLSTKEVLA